MSFWSLFVCFYQLLHNNFFFFFETSTRIHKSNTVKKEIETHNMNTTWNKWYRHTRVELSTHHTVTTTITTKTQARTKKTEKQSWNKFIAFLPFRTLWIRCVFLFFLSFVFYFVVRKLGFITSERRFFCFLCQFSFFGSLSLSHPVWFNFVCCFLFDLIKFRFISLSTERGRKNPEMTQIKMTSNAIQYTQYHYWRHKIEMKMMWNESKRKKNWKFQWLWWWRWWWDSNWFTASCYQDCKLSVKVYLYICLCEMTFAFQQWTPNNNKTKVREHYTMPHTKQWKKFAKAEK